MWSNLYKVSPYAKGNPNDTLKDNINAVCVKILKEEIAEYDPTHIVFVTDYSSWFDNFEKDLEIEYKEFNGLRTVIKAGRIKGIPFVVTKRPEFLGVSRSVQAEEIFEALGLKTE